MARTKHDTRPACNWIDEGECYDTSCGHAFVLNTGTPAENHMRYCPYCGKRLRTFERKP